MYPHSISRKGLKWQYSREEQSFFDQQIVALYKGKHTLKRKFEALNSLELSSFLPATRIGVSDTFLIKLAFLVIST